ncbi:hypothetical protein GOBAR_DD29661 [Gossypium barbadense]|nr:hypothetical protein GOBAR_DD29661 [Gossypium barbadense]
MASFATQILFILLFTLFSTFFIKINGEFLRQSIIMSTKRVEKITCLHFYFHDIVDGKHPTAMQIIRRSLSLLKNLWEELKRSMLSLLNMILGMYNGSAVSIVGRCAILDAVREMPLSEVVEFSGLAVAVLWQRQFGLIRMEML